MLRCEKFEKLGEHTFAVTLAGPYDLALVVINDNGQVFVPLAITGFVNTYVHESVEAMLGVRVDILFHTADDRSDCVPGYPHKSRNHLFGAVLCKPCDLLLELIGEAAIMPCPIAKTKTIKIVVR